MGLAHLAEPKGKHDPERVAVRHGQECGSVTLGGRRVPVQRPLVRAAIHNHGQALITRVTDCDRP